MDMAPFDIFLVAPPGLEPALADEARAAGFADPVVTEGGVTVTGGWPDVWRANLMLRGAARVLARIGSFRAMHLAQLDKRARKFPWADTLRPDVPLKVEVSTRASRIYHAGAAQQRIEGGLQAAGFTTTPEAGLTLKVRIEDDLCTFSIDTSGEPLHRRGLKQAVGKAPMRETMAALMLRACGYDGSEPLVDPMCGSGTFPIEAAEMAAGLFPGRARTFAFEKLASFDAPAWQALRGSARPVLPPARFFGSDRDSGAIRMATANAERAGVAPCITFTRAAISDLARPEGPPGLVIVNPPYGARIGERKLLFGLYATLGKVLAERFSGWRVAIVTSDAGLAKATALPFLPPGPPIAHGGLKVVLYRTAALA
ncbi:MAG: class I SAM-dependent RNA methyltransferase [Limimaricola sp.]|uniref:THUMP domain-containing class I SAM-dependent RNA methyltransferase n=1 Tax=Limimaricola sp. TaxID=2211665 RepID=UPI001E12378E|nr:class I SAM-dependent RNA methyltransferase [Limimaricola sp.]MBI1416069.1 class I SAM-dependent RNA methyltransferase [Limimaricola sp.]